MLAIDRIGLPNIVLGGPTPVFREFLQGDFTGENLAREALAVLASPERRAELEAAARTVAERLQGGETSHRVAEEILALAGRGPAPQSLAGPAAAGAESGTLASTSIATRQGD